jgi:hypothetical protein
MLICQSHQSILRFLSTAAMASTQWRGRELYCRTSYSDVELYFHAFFPSSVDGGELSDSRTGRFTAGKSGPVPIGCWIPLASVLMRVKRINPCFCPELQSPDRPVRSPVILLTELSQLPFRTYVYILAVRKRTSRLV